MAGRCWHVCRRSSGQGGCAASLLMLQQKQQLDDLFSGCLEEGFLLCGKSSRCRTFLSTIMKIVLGRKETMGASSGCCHRRRFVLDPGLPEEVKVVAVRLGLHEVQLLGCYSSLNELFSVCDSF